jgi:hypothetical protein
MCGMAFSQVRKVSALQRTAQVQWLREGATLPSSSTAEGLLDHWDDVTVCSVYELMEHPDFSYRLGDVVNPVYPPHQYLLYLASFKHP